MTVTLGHLDRDPVTVRKRYIAVVADNTGTMQTMFLCLLTVYPFLFMMGCCVHILDLLIEDIAKIGEIASIGGDSHFVISFVKKHGVLHELFLEIQLELKIKNSLKLFPLTRFAYLCLMIHTELVNFRVSAVPNGCYTILRRLLLRRCSKRLRSTNYIRL